MAIRATCSGCGQVFQAPVAMAGKAGKCPKCGANFAVPSESVGAAAATASSSSVDSGSPAEIPEMTSWADDILGELPANAGPQQSGPLGPSPSPLSASSTAGLKPTPTPNAGGGLGGFFWKMIGYRWYFLAALSFIAVVFSSLVSLSRHSSLLICAILALPGLLIVVLGVFPYAYQRTVRLRRPTQWARPGDPEYISPWSDIGIFWG